MEIKAMVGDEISGRRVLFVDDEKNMLKYFPACIGRDVEVVTCSSADEALSILESEGQNFDAVVSDDRMPGLWGGDLLGIIALRWPHMARILTTAFTDIDRLSGLIGSHKIQRVIMKPWETAELRETIGATIGMALGEEQVGAESESHAESSPRDFHQAIANFPPSPALVRRSELHGATTAYECLAWEIATAATLPTTGFELGTCTIRVCIDEAFAHLSARGLAQAQIEDASSENLYVHSNPSCLGGALADILGLSIIATRGVPNGKVSIEYSVRPECINLVITNNGDWSSEGFINILLGDARAPAEPRPGVGLLVAAWVVVGCGGRVNLLSHGGRTGFVISLPRARN